MFNFTDTTLVEDEITNKGLKHFPQITADNKYWGDLGRATYSCVCGCMDCKSPLAPMEMSTPYAAQTICASLYLNLPNKHELTCEAAPAISA